MGKYVPDETDERVESIKEGIQQAHDGKTTPANEVLDNLGLTDKEQEANQVKHLDDDYDKFFRSFTNIRPEGDQIERIETLRDDYKAVLSTIIALTNRTPERTIALRKLEESLMYAVKCIVLET